jgi:protein required for attachment to host cells
MKRRSRRWMIAPDLGEQAMILPNGTIVAVIDGEHMRLFRNRGREPRIELVAEPEPHLDIVNTGSGGRHHSTSANPDRSRLREDDLAAAAAAYLNGEALEGRIVGCVIVADTRTLGEMRKHFHHALAGKLLGELHKDLAGHPVRAIEEALAAA